MYKQVFFAFVVFLSQNAFAQESVTLGQQTLKFIDLPESTSVWKRMEGIGDRSLPKTEEREARLEQIVKMLGTPMPLDTEKIESLAYWLFLPNTYKADRSEKGSPLLLFLHGAGERGDNPKLVHSHGPPKLLLDAEKAKDWPFVTVSPQCPQDKFWSPVQLLLLLDSIEKEYNIDRSRIYVSGLSMGGFGTWMLISQAPERFAAAAPICGGCDFSQVEKLTNTPIWAFHGDQDWLVPAVLSQRMISGIEKNGGKKAKITIYPGVGHDSWTETYNNPQLYKWLLGNRLEAGDRRH